jgi:hypothetical protein
MTRRFVFIALVISIAMPALHAQTTCNGSRLLTVGGPIRLDVPAFNVTLPDPTAPETVVDVSHPALTRYATPTVIFEYAFPDTRPISIYFAAVRPEAQSYTVDDQTPVFQVAAQSASSVGRVEVRQILLDHPLVFDAGELLAIEVMPASGTSSGLVFYDSPSPQGVLVGNIRLTQTGAAALSDLASIRSTAVAVNMAATVACGVVPAPELFIPDVGDIQGLAHYVTDVTLFAVSPTFSAPVTANWTIRDRQQNPNAVTLINGTATTGSSGLGTFTTLPTTSYFGTMTISFPGYNGLYQTNDTSRLSDDVTATARIVARIPLGETGSSINGVSCEKIGHVIAVPFHIVPNHRVNIGIASAQLNSCGIFKAATSVLVSVNGGAPVTIAMPAESIQLNDITATNSPLPGAAGLTDGVVTITVTDEATRVVGYSSLLDNTSQSATLNYGTVVR